MAYPTDFSLEITVAKGIDPFASRMSKIVSLLSTEAYAQIIQARWRKWVLVLRFQLTGPQRLLYKTGDGLSLSFPR